MTHPSIRQGGRGFTAVPVIAVMLLAGCGPLPARDNTAGADWPRPVSGRGCMERGGLPDARCTPGAIRAGVTLATICAYGYSRSIRPPESYTEPLKLRQMRAYDLPGRARDYEEDHLVGAVDRRGAEGPGEPLARATQRPLQRRAEGRARELVI